MKVSSWTIGLRVSAVSALLIGLVVTAGGAGLIGMAKMKSITAKMGEDSVAGMDKLSQAEYLMFEMRGNSVVLSLPDLPANIRTRSQARIEQLESAVPALLKSYGDSGAVSESERPLFEATSAATADYIGSLRKFRELTAAGKPQEAISFFDSVNTPKRIALQNAYKAELDFERHTLVGSIQQVTAIATSYSGGTWLVFVLAISIGTFLVILVTRGINASLRVSAGEIRSGASEVAAAAAQVANASEQLAQAASEQAASLEETSASGQQVSAMTQRNAENSQTAAGLMTEVDTRVVLANRKLEQMVVSMGEITSSSERIAKIIKVIDEIAFQTNILALNAAVEAARAGEAGLGFAVVAEEVRNLAQRCAQAAKDTTQLIDASVSSARNGRGHLDEVADVIRDITASAVKVKTLVDEVSHGGVEQARGIDQISRALVQMEQTTQESAANAEESASASQQLKAQAASMESVVLTLEGLIARSAESGAVRVRVSSGTPTVRAARPGLSTAGILRLKKGVGVSRTPSEVMARAANPAEPVMMEAGTSKSMAGGFPLDDSEFSEF